MCSVLNVDGIILGIIHIQKDMEELMRKSKNYVGCVFIRELGIMEIRNRKIMIKYTLESAMG